MEQVMSCGVSEVRPLFLTDFTDSLKKVRKSVPPSSLQAFDSWNREYGDIST